MKRILAVLALIGCGWPTMVLATARPADAHPLDVYLQSAYLTLAPGHIDLELKLSAGVLVAPAVLRDLDPDTDRRITAAEAARYVDRALRAITLRVDGRRLRPAVTALDVPPYLTVQAGYGVLRVFATAAGAPTSVGRHSMLFRNGFSPPGAAYQVNAFVDRGARVTLGRQHRDGRQQQSAVDYTVGGAVHAAADRVDAGRTSSTGRLASYVTDRSGSTWLLPLAIGFAAVLGALHALTPGHGKTLIAAYLTGSGGTVRNAVALGATVTVTHTASVLLIGLAAVLAGRFVVPSVLVPALEGLSGALVAVLGVRLLWNRRSALTSGGRSGGHQHPHTATTRGVVALGVSGGLVPCPEALGVLIVAVGLNRIGTGLALIVSFSAGLAAVLIGLGCALVRSRAAVVRRTGSLSARWVAVLPLVSAAVVTALGIALLLRAVG